MTPEDIGAVRQELAAIGVRLEELRDAIRDSTATHAAAEIKREDRAVPKTVNAVVSFDDQTTRDTKADNDRQYGTQNSIKRAAWCAFFAAFVYAAIAAVQFPEFKKSADAAKSAADTAYSALQSSNQSAANTLIEMQKQSTAMRATAEASENGVRLARQNFMNDQRPYVFAAEVKPTLGPNLKIRADLWFVNFGRSPAIRSHGRGAIFFGSNAMQEADRWFKTEAPKPFPNEKGGAIIPVGVPSNTQEGPGFNRTTILSDGVVSQTDFDFITNHDFSAVIVLRQEYFDIFGNRYWSNGCWSYFITGAIPQCPNHNEAR